MAEQPKRRFEKIRGRGAGVLKWLQRTGPWALLAAGAAFRFAEPSLVVDLQNRVFDSYNRIRPRPYEEVPVRIIDLDDESLKRLGQWPWPRTQVAALVKRLAGLGASAIVFDIVFSEPDRTSPSRIVPLWPQTADLEAVKGRIRRLPDHDQVLGREIARAPVVLGAALTAEKNGELPQVKASFGQAGDDPLSYVIAFDGAINNLPVLMEGASGAGAFNTITDRDGIIRRVPMVLRVGDALVPSLSAEALRVAQGAATIAIKAAGASGEASFGARTGISKVKIGQLTIPTDANGRMFVYYSSVFNQRTLSAWEVLDKNFDRSKVEGCITIIGTSAAGLKDQRATPLNPVAPGVEVHAQVIEQALLGRFLERPDWADGAEVVYLLVLGALLIVLLKRFGAGWGAWIAGGAIAFAVGFSWHAFTDWQWLIDPVFPTIVILAIYLMSTLISYLKSEGERKHVRSAFSRYMSPALAEVLAANPEKLKLGGEARVMTFHFCDIQGFTSISEIYDPAGLIKFLNGFLTPMTEIILDHKGTIDKYIGDCIMAYWNAPIDDPEHAQNACLAALEMHAALKDLNEERKAEAEREGKKFIPIKIRTGLNTGSCIVGNMGSEHRFDYSVLGDDVNLASRLEGANKFFGTYTMVSEATYQGAHGAVIGRELGRVRVVGKALPIKVYNLLARAGELSPEWAKALPAYEEGLVQFHKRDFSGASALFKKVLESFPEDGPAKLYMQVADDYAAIPPPDDWDGVFNLTAK